MLKYGVTWRQRSEDFRKGFNLLLRQVKLAMIKSRVVNIHSKSQMLDMIKKASKLICEGGLVVYPTESCYGLGCNALDEAAVNCATGLRGQEETFENTSSNHCF